MSKTDIDVTSDTAFTDSVSTKKATNTVSSGSSSGKTIVNQACKYCGEQINNAEVKDGKVNCPSCEKDN